MKTPKRGLTAEEALANVAWSGEELAKGIDHLTAIVAGLCDPAREATREGIAREINRALVSLLEVARRMQHICPQVPVLLEELAEMRRALRRQRAEGSSAWPGEEDGEEHRPREKPSKGRRQRQ
jgi:hypothetical protein